MGRSGSAPELVQEVVYSVESTWFHPELVQERPPEVRAETVRTGGPLRVLVFPTGGWRRKRKTASQWRAARWPSCSAVAPWWRFDALTGDDVHFHVPLPATELAIKFFEVAVEASRYIGVEACNRLPRPPGRWIFTVRTWTKLPARSPENEYVWSWQYKVERSPGLVSVCSWSGSRAYNRV
jgi:hypothetical protein